MRIHTRHSLGVIALGCAAMVYAQGCSGGKKSSSSSAVTATPTQPGVLTGLTVLPPGLTQLEARPGEDFQIIVDGSYDDQGTLFDRDVTRAVTYTVADESVVTIGADGLITAVGQGATTIDIELETASGRQTATKTVSVIAPVTSAAVFTELRVYPPFRNLVDVTPGHEQLQQLVVVGVANTGRLHDLTREVTLMVQGMQGGATNLASVNGTGLLRGVAPGEVLVSAREDTFVAGSHIVMGPTPIAHAITPNSLYSGAPLAGSTNPFDVAVFENLITQLIEPAPLAGDVEFQRRLYLDALARTPTEAEQIAFIASPAATKRAMEIEEVLKKPEFDRRWAAIFPEWFRMGRGQNADDFEQWSLTQLATGATFDHMLTQIIEGQVAAFEAQKPLPGDKVDTIVESAAGMDVKCARCHAHFLTGPADEPFWTAENRFALDAFFATTPEEATPHDAGLGGLRFGLPVGDPQQPGFAFDPSVTVTSTLNDPIPQRRAEFARLFVATRDFAKGLGHRIFSEVMVELINSGQMSYRANIDAMKVPNVLETVGDVFQDQGTLEGFLRVLFNSKTYQLSMATTTPEHAALLASHAPRRNHAEVVITTLAAVTGVPIVDPAELGFVRTTFGFPAARAQTTERLDRPNTAQALLLMNSPILATQLTNSGGVVAALAADVTGNVLTEDEAIERLFRLSLSRAPNATELADCRQLIQDAADVREGLEDVAAVLVSSTEFVMR
jgi:hypothetical protein